MRNAVNRKTHKERSQPSSRAKFGLLEKHKVTDAKGPWATHQPQGKS